MRYQSSLFSLLATGAVAIAGCALEGGSDPSDSVSESLESDGGECVLDPLTISVLGSTQSTLEIRVCAGASGAPGGFSLGWMTADEFATLGQQWPGTECMASFPDPLDSNECVNLQLGNPSQESGACASCNELECGTEFVVHGRAEASCKCEASQDSCPTKGSTMECKEKEGCTLTQGFWKNHPDAWPVSSLTLGGVTYTQAQLLEILKTPVAGNGLIQLAHQLIAAKLNVASGASDADVADGISAADALIGSLVVPPVGGGFLAPSSTSGLTGELDNFNEGETGPGHCEDDADQSEDKRK